ncbi:hypothetical protein GCM10010840_02070 [Deinococcus aerolatus]|uniref:Uncharacterized protein n=1 Tax=Deinococcus aerolatus TaxID=522487 RepID=A0ABQ2FZM1_9DEIO|nr:hypothetical protein GCM10010840_02070 [Deinococcus aerolatus]
MGFTRPSINGCPPGAERNQRGEGRAAPPDPQLRGNAAASRSHCERVACPPPAFKVY